jgi:hypothetical protein
MKKIALTLGIIGSFILLAIGCSGSPSATDTPATDSSTKTETVTPAASEYFVKATVDGKEMEFNRDPEAYYSAGLTLVGGFGANNDNIDITFPGKIMGTFDKTTSDPDRALGLHLNLQGTPAKSYQNNADSEGGIPEVKITKYDETGVTGTFSGKMMEVTPTGYVTENVIEVSGEFNVPIRAASK